MLSNVKLNNKTFLQLVEEAQNLIPIYTKEWTNFNPSDPGMTAVEIFSGLTIFQQQYLDQVSDEVKLRLLKLLGYYPGNNEPATTTLNALTENGIKLLKGTKFMSGGVCFENIETVEHSNIAIKAILSDKDGALRDMSYIIGNKTNMRVPIFDAKSKDGSALYLVLDVGPRPKSCFAFDFKISFGECVRNPIDRQSDFTLADIHWQAHCGGEWTDIAAEDGTHGFLQSGSVLLHMPDAELDCSYMDGYTVRALLANNHYELAPSLISATANTFAVEQTDTLVKCNVFSSDGDGFSELCLDDAMALHDYNLVFVKDSDDDYYRLYQRANPQKDEHGRYFDMRRSDDMVTHISFDRTKFGCAPIRGDDAVRVVSYDERSFLARSVGTVLGYDEQVLEVGATDIVAARFEVMVSEKDHRGELCFYPARPGGKNNEQMCYDIDERTGNMTITACGSDDDNTILISSLVKCHGDGGNVRSGENMTIKRPIREYLPQNVEIFNPRSAEGGRSAKTIEELRREFAAELNMPSRAVTCEDYEELVRRIPGLLVHKVRASSSSGENMIKVAVKPYSDEEYPVLSQEYIRIIAKALDSARLLATRIEVVSPQYLPVDVYGTVYVKPHFPDSRAMIEELIRRELDGIKSDKRFGTKILYGDIYAKIEKLPCVDYIYSFAMTPGAEIGVKKNGFNFEPDFNVLAYMRRCNIEINTKAIVR